MDGVLHEYEIDGLAKLTGEYCRTNKREAFTEAFEYVVNAPNLPLFMNNIEECIPITYRYIIECYLGAEGYIDNEKVSEIHQVAIEMYETPKDAQQTEVTEVEPVKPENVIIDNAA